MQVSLRSSSQYQNPYPQRNKNGNMLILVLVVICFVIIPALMFSYYSTLSILQHEQYQNVVDAACLLSAKDF